VKQAERDRRQERGQTLLLVVVAMSVLLGMAALAIDIATLYTAHNETRRTAEAAALAGAQVFVSSGVTSGWLPQSTVCSGNVGSPGLVEQRALTVVAQNPVAGGAATLQAASCNFGTSGNPQLTVTVQRTGLPTFFGRLFGGFAGTATITATAEAYNPSGTSGPPIRVGSVKPWAVPNCDPTNSAPSNSVCGAGAYFVNPSSGIANFGSIVGNVVDLTEVHDPSPSTPLPGGSWTSTGPPNINMLAVDVPITAASASCPASGTFSCNATLQPATPGYGETIACANSTTLSCGQTLNVHSTSGNLSPQLTDQVDALCLIHANNPGRNMGQDQFCNNGLVPNCTAGSPIPIQGGDNNPDPGLQGQPGVSRSDSVVTVPIFNPCGTGCTNGSVTVVGFLQLGVARVRASGPLRTVVMNVVGCGSTSGSNPVTGGGVSPIPVRLVQ
jgi:hypothetical protein